MNLLHIRWGSVSLSLAFVFLLVFSLMGSAAMKKPEEIERAARRSLEKGQFAECITICQKLQECGPAFVPVGACIAGTAAYAKGDVEGGIGLIRVAARNGSKEAAAWLLEHGE